MNQEELIKYFEKIRKDFPILKQKINNKNLVYVDNAATTQKPNVVIDSISDYYKTYNSNIHRGIHSLAEKANSEYEKVRDKVSNLINSNSDEIVFTKGTTDSVNIVANGLTNQIKKGDEIVLSEAEHHANLVPWQELAKKTGAKLKFIKLDKDFKLDIKSAKELITNKTKIIAISHISNVLGTRNPIEEIIKLAHKNDSLILIDCAQSISHELIDVKKLDVDFIVFSSHKMYGPLGVGVLYGKYDLLDKLNPKDFGGDMIYEVELKESSYAKPPLKFESGTPNIADVIGFGVAIDYIQKIGLENIQKYEKYLTKYFLDRIDKMDNFKYFGSRKLENKVPLFSFNIKGIHSHDMSSILDQRGIAIRGGHHCAMPLAKLLGISSTSRISLCFYNTTEEIDYIIDCLNKSTDDFEKGAFLSS